MTASRMSAFYWNTGESTVFAQDSRFTGNRKNGKTASQVSSETVARLTEETGKNPGSIAGLSDRGDALIEQSNYRRGRK
jgi:hypothetical protein